MTECYHEHKPTTVEANEWPGIVLSAECEKCGDRIIAEDITVRQLEGIDSLEADKWISEEKA